MSGAIPEELRRFVRAHIRSLLQFEALLILARDSQRWWTAREVSVENRSSEDASLAQLGRLAELGLLESRGTGTGTGFRFQPRDPDYVALVESLRELHAQRYHSLVDLIYSSDRAQEFANAFKIRKSDDDG
jgi:hypothetical protein